MEMRTKQEVIQFLESKVGTKVKCVGNASLDGMCVTLIKSLMEFLGVPDPYKARGHAKTAISTYINEGIAKQGTGILSVYSNKDMGGGYGHIWCSIDGTFYESNGVKTLTVTKGKTYSYDMICNFDQYITDNTYRGYDLSNAESMRICVDDHIRVAEGQLIDKSQYESIKGQLTESQKRVEELSSELGTSNSTNKALTDKVQSLNNVVGEYQKEDAVQISQLKESYDRETKATTARFLLIKELRAELKLSSTINDIDEAENEAINAVQSLYQTNGSLQSKVLDLEKEIKRLSTHKMPIDKLSISQVIILLIEKLKGLYGKK